MKKMISILLVFVFVLSVFPLTVSAEGDYPTDAYEAIFNGMSNAETSISVSEYYLTDDELHLIMDEIRNTCPEIFYFSGGYSWTIRSGTIISVKPKYSYSAEEIAVGKAFVEDQLTAIVDTVPANLDDYQKVLYLHDYICVNFEYDLTYSNYEIYSMLTDKAGVCQAYAFLYAALLERVGITSRPVRSDSLNHMWNEVLVNGKWYQVDVTWDDPVADRFSRARHEYFMLSDSASQTVHDGATDIEVTYPCTDTTFDNYSWHDSDSSAAFANGKTYMVSGFNIVEIDLLTDKSSVVYTVDGKWYLPGNRYYTGSYTSLGTYYNKIIFNTSKSVLSLDLETMKVSVLLTLPESDENIYGLTVVGNTVYYNTKIYVGDEDVILSYEIPKEGITFLLGDVDGDGELRGIDYLLLKRYVCGIYNLNDAGLQRADYDCNGKVNGTDYFRLKRAILGL